jgi:hypothetical protein
VRGPRFLQRLVLVPLMLSVAVGAPAPARAEAISVDSGITPAQRRVVLRTQLRYLRRADPQWDSSPSMEMFMVPVVAVWGALPKLTLMARAAVAHREMTMMGGMMGGTMMSSSKETSTGLGDLLILMKYGAYRMNTRHFVLGIAPTLGVEVPSGLGGFSSKTWDLHAGVHLTGRWRRLTVGLSTKYIWNGMDRAGSTAKDPGDEVGVDLAVSHVFPLPGNPDFAFSPVLEMSFRHAWKTNHDGRLSGAMAERFLYVSPGLLFITRWVIIEALVQLPAWQESGVGMDPRQFSLITGVRLLL